MTRETRLKPIYASLYPALRDGVWEPASVVVDKLIAALLNEGAALAAILTGRLLDERHFEFRGEAHADGPPAERRLGDCGWPRGRRYGSGSLAHRGRAPEAR
ncbi:MAG TPA: hypothetical protein VFU46_11090 [Gemmatimonadales bacterium]|nr:hypothetical protein [Gemmatimonadales bacterium]